MGSKSVKTSDVPWEVRRHLLCKQMGWRPDQVDAMPWMDVLWTEQLISIEAKAEKALADRQDLKGG
jgi:hypothetical protein